MLENPAWEHNFISFGKLSPHKFNKPSERAHVIRREVLKYGGEDSLLIDRSASPVNRRRENIHFNESIGETTVLGAISLPDEVVSPSFEDDQDSDINYYEDNDFLVSSSSLALSSSESAVPMPSHLASKAEIYWMKLVEGEFEFTVLIFI